MLRYLFLLSATLFLFSACTEKPLTEEQKFENVTFDVDGKSDFTFVNATSDTINFFLRDWVRLPSDFIEHEQKVAPNDSFHVQLKTQGFKYFEFYFNDSSFKVFNAPSANTTFHKLQDTSYFKGDFDTINNFLKPSGGNHYRNMETTMNLINLTQRENYGFQDLMDKNDTVIKNATRHLLANKNEIPHWYIELEKDRLKILGASFKLNSLMYRKRMLNYVDEIPDWYVQQIMDDIPIENEKLMGFDIFTHLLREYSQQSVWPLYDTNQTERVAVDSLFEFMDTQFTPQISDFTLVNYLSLGIQIQLDFKVRKWIDLIEAPAYKALLLEQKENKKTLPRGTTAPLVSGILPDSTAFSTDQLKDSIVLINFWASYCKPCINKFGLENELVEQLKDQPVKIVNVCIETEWESFIALIDIYQLKTTNVFVDESNLKKTRDAFGIQGIPHGVLVDKEGLIIKNKYHVRQDSTQIYIESLLQ